MRRRGVIQRIRDLTTETRRARSSEQVSFRTFHSASSAPLRCKSREFIHPETIRVRRPQSNKSVCGDCLENATRDLERGIQGNPDSKSEHDVEISPTA